MPPIVPSTSPTRSPHSAAGKSGNSLGQRQDGNARTAADRIDADSAAIATLAGGLVIGAFFPHPADAKALDGRGLDGRGLEGRAPDGFDARPAVSDRAPSGHGEVGLAQATIAPGDATTHADRDDARHLASVSPTPDADHVFSAPGSSNAPSLAAAAGHQSADTVAATPSYAASAEVAASHLSGTAAHDAGVQSHAILQPINVSDRDPMALGSHAESGMEGGSAHLDATIAAAAGETAKFGTPSDLASAGHTALVADASSAAADALSGAVHDAAGQVAGVLATETDALPPVFEGLHATDELASALPSLDPHQLGQEAGHVVTATTAAVIDGGSPSIQALSHDGAPLGLTDPASAGSGVGDAAHSVTAALHEPLPAVTSPAAEVEGGAHEAIQQTAVPLAAVSHVADTAHVSAPLGHALSSEAPSDAAQPAGHVPLPSALPDLNLGFLGQSYADLHHGEIGSHHDQGLLHGLV